MLYFCIFCWSNLWIPTNKVHCDAVHEALLLRSWIGMIEKFNGYCTEMRIRNVLEGLLDERFFFLLENRTTENISTEHKINMYCIVTMRCYEQWLAFEIPNQSVHMQCVCVWMCGLMVCWTCISFTSPLIINHAVESLCKLMIKTWTKQTKQLTPYFELNNQKKKNIWISIVSTNWCMKWNVQKRPSRLTSHFGRPTMCERERGRKIVRERDVHKWSITCKAHKALFIICRITEH